MSSTNATDRIRVAAADDHAAFLEGLTALLSLEDDIDVVASATNGVEAIEAVRRHRPDILLLDLRMPGLDGLGALRRLSRAENPTRIIVLTASEDRLDYVQAISDGAAGVALKGDAVDQLADCIRAVHAGQIWLADEALPLPDEAPDAAEAYSL
jgi:DNA-binding NarL/FixJ family response regulator